MLMSHLAALRLVCPACRGPRSRASVLEVRTVLHVDSTRAGADLLDGVLVCPGCQREHPVIDGIAIVVADLAAWAVDQLEPAVRRHDLSPILERLLAAVAVADSSFTRERQALTTAVAAHWHDREVGAEVAAPDTFARRCASAVAALPSAPTGRWLDLGCGAGRGTFQLAAAGAAIAIGVDVDMALLRRAEQARRTGQVEWPRPGGDRAVAEVGALPRDRVGFDCADLGALPFTDGGFDGGQALAAPLPASHQAELARVVQLGGGQALP